MLSTAKASWTSAAKTELCCGPITGHIAGETLGGTGALVKTPTQDDPQAEQQLVTPITRTFEPEEFDVDADEERPVAVLAERRQQFLSVLKARGPRSNQ